MYGNDHDHRGQYADDRHDHGLDYAEKYHRHYDDESTARGLREDLGHAEARISELENELHDAFGRIGKLEQTVSVYGDLLDEVRNRVHALEHGTRYEPEPADDDEEPQS
jgi:hypothetical protein